MTEQFDGAVVAILMIRGERDGDGIQVSGTSVSWTMEDAGDAATLREQLTGLLGDPYGESILPAISGDALKDVAGQMAWPGAVKISQDDS